MATHDLNIEDLMQGIREEVRRKREQDGMNVSRVNPIGEIWHPVDTHAITEALTIAERVHAVGQNLPPMTRQRGMRRKMAILAARVFLRIAQIITRDQRDFNFSSIAALRAMHDSLNGLEQGLAVVRGDVAMRVQELLQRVEVWRKDTIGSAQELEHRLAAVHEDAIGGIQALEQGLTAAGEETSTRIQALEGELAATREETSTRIQALEKTLSATQTYPPYKFDDATFPGHIPTHAVQPHQKSVPIVSYAQNREDVLLHRIFGSRRNGFYIDVGAHDPVDCSVSKLFYNQGWHGINVEPLPEMFRRLCAARARDINLNCGLSNCEGILTFYESSMELGLSTFSFNQFEDRRKAGFEFIERQCPVTTLARICEQYASAEIDFISIDVEGHEREVIEGADWKRWRPRVIVIEATKPYTNIPNHDLWEPLLLAADYVFAAFDGINRYYVRAEDRECIPILSTPVNVLDYYVPFEYLRQIEELRARIATLQGQAVGT